MSIEKSTMSYTNYNLPKQPAPFFSSSPPSLSWNDFRKMSNTNSDFRDFAPDFSSSSLVPVSLKQSHTSPIIMATIAECTACKMAKQFLQDAKIGPDKIQVVDCRETKHEVCKMSNAVPAYFAKNKQGKYIMLQKGVTKDFKQLFDTAKNNQ